jgi:hypothetical protein
MGRLTLSSAWETFCGTEEVVLERGKVVLLRISQRGGCLFVMKTSMGIPEVGLGYSLIP